MKEFETITTRVMPAFRRWSNEKQSIPSQQNLQQDDAAT